MRKPVTKWTSEDVAKWVEGLGDWAKHNYSQIFRKEVGRERRIEGRKGR